MTTPKILVVDDEPFNVDFLEQELEELNYETVTASNGQEALVQIQEKLPDLVLLDIMMPIMDGFQVLRHIKADLCTRDIPVIVISANTDLNSVVHGIELGAEDYLPKPFDPTLLRARVSTCLEKKRLHDLEQLYLKSLEKEMDIARNIQRGFLPAVLPNPKGWELATYFKAAREVAGDFYDACFLPDGNLMMVVGDVCDKGVGAALFMTLFRSLLRAAATTDVFCGCNGSKMPCLREHLLNVVSFTNKYIADTHGDSSMFATLLIGMLNLQDGTLAYLNGGNEPGFVLRNGNVVATLNPTGPVIGIMPDAYFCVKEIVLDRNDLLVAYTDGIPDARNIRDEAFGHERLITLLRTHATTAKTLAESIEMEVHSFIGAAHQFDDITLLCLRRNDE